MDNKIAIIKKCAFQDGAAKGMEEMKDMVLEELSYTRSKWKSEADYLEFYYAIRDMV